MTTILEAHTARGGSRRCDAVCHEARGTRCGCICGGRFHGIGSEGAERISPEVLAEVRETIDLDTDLHLQLRIGA